MKHVCKRLSCFLMTVFFATMIITDTACADMDAMDEMDVWSDISDEIDEAPGYEDPKDSERQWALSLGVVGGVAPDYEGSDDYEFGLGPNIAASWRDRIFYKGKSLGVNVLKTKNFKAGPLLAWTSGRDEDDNNRLTGLGDIDSTIEAGGFMSYRMKPLRFRLEVRQDIDSGHDGALVELSGGTGYPFEKPLVFVSLGATWASDDYMESFFGIDSQQSAASGLQEYSADSGIKDVNIGLTAGYSITNRWRVGGKLEYKRLVGDAEDSPIVDDENQFRAGITLSYRMGSKVNAAEMELE